MAEAIRNDKVVGYFGTAQAVPFPLALHEKDRQCAKLHLSELPMPKDAPVRP